MPRRNDICKVLVIGSGPIVIGQSAEFDYSGTQACKALKAEGYEVVLANSNPATIMTDPEVADRTYIEPLTREYLEEIIRIESEMQIPRYARDDKRREEMHTPRYARDDKRREEMHTPRYARDDKGREMQIPRYARDDKREDKGREESQILGYARDDKGREEMHTPRFARDDKREDKRREEMQIPGQARDDKHTGFALLPTVGGQTALNLAVDLADGGVLEKYGVQLIGAQLGAIKKAEDRLLFKDAMARIGLDVPRSALVNNLKDGLEFSGKIGFPVILRPSFTLGGTGGGIAYNREELLELLARGLDLSPVHEVLIEESVLGWKEFELEVMRDLRDNVIIVCSIENFDPMGVHTGDSITVAPAQTLTDREYQAMRDAAIKVIREIGVETGGSNIQFAVQPTTGRMVVIEMNPRVSRSSALASKATGFPIAKIAAKLAVGYTLDEIPNDITRKTPACFEPTLDYVVVKIPKWQFEKFPGADENLGPQMKSVGEVMAIGRTFK